MPLSCVIYQKCNDWSCLFLLVPVNNPVRSSGYRNSRCSLCINKIGLVRLPGELGTRIEDDIIGSSRLIGDQNRPYTTAAVYEESTYRLHVQLDCGGQFDSPCSNSLSVIAWIDYNDNEYDDAESRILQRSWSDNGTPTGAFDLGINVPTTREGPHRMRITVRPTDAYQRECGTVGYEETRDYTINVVRRIRPTRKFLSFS